MLNKMKDSKSALKIKQLISIFLIMMTLITNITLFRVNKGGIQLANIQININKKVNLDVQENIIVAQVNKTYERDTKVTTRSEIDRSNDTKQEEVIVKYKTIDEVEISRNMDLSIRTGLSKEDFNTLLANLKSDTSGFFERNSSTIYDLCEKYEINELFFCGLIAAESGWKIAGSHRRTNNFVSMMSGGKLIKYASEAEGLEAAAKLLHNHYLTETGAYYRGKTLSGVQVRYCPGSSTWVGLVYGCMKYIINQ